MKNKDLAGKTKNELEKILTKSEKELFDLRMDNSLQKLKNPHTITEKRKEVARIKTKIRMEDLTV